MEIKQKCFIAYAYIFMALHKYKRIMREKIEQAHGNSPNLSRNLRPTLAVMKSNKYLFEIFNAFQSRLWNGLLVFSFDARDARDV